MPNERCSITMMSAWYCTFNDKDLDKPSIKAALELHLFGCLEYWAVRNLGKDANKKAALAAFGCLLLLLICPATERQALLIEMAALNRLAAKLDLNVDPDGDEQRFLDKANDGYYDYWFLDLAQQVNHTIDYFSIEKCPRLDMTKL
ncbi:unnamed protein product [Fusarium equiseti]|uniref:Uncharacterized protein n=1 Tax=Fusarium equiseti TaxID=61235 RepID=A0A8J2NH37_FUSEQ|nr:unnamed protein product [Fusarium equiseti]